MKRAVLSGLMLLLGAALVSAFGLSVIAEGGYAFGLDSETYGTDVERTTSGDYVRYENKFHDLAWGPRASGELDVAFGHYFSLAAGGGYVLGTPGNFAVYVQKFVQNRDAKMTTSFVPLFLTLEGRVPVWRFDFHFGAGPSMGILAKSMITDDQTFPFPYVGPGGTPGQYHWELETTYTAGWGFHGVAGVDFRLAKWLSLRAEARGEELTFRPKKTVITAYTLDGVDQLMTAYPNVSDRETIYVDDLSAYKNKPVNPNAPSQELAFNISADSITVFVGVVFTIF